MGINPEIYIGSFEDNSCIEYLEAKIHRLEDLFVDGCPDRLSRMDLCLEF